MDGTERAIRKAALQNAFEHGGKTEEKIVLSKVLGMMPELRGSAGKVAALVGPIVSDVNGMGVERQGEELESEHGGVPEARQAREERGLPELAGAIQGGVITRFPPEPNGYPHIGHAKAAIINEEYVTKYGGKKILRMDDTNPESERLEYYAAIKVGLDWLGIKYDAIKNTSDDMELLLEKGRELINSGDAYVCTCKRDDISKNRRQMITCKCSRADAGENAERWEKMSGKFKQGKAVARLRGDMGSDNTVMRDPVLFRIIDARHPLLGDRYRVWPSYDLAVAVEDSVDGVTHAFRSKEYELRNELYHAILDRLGMRKPEVLEFSRLELEGMPVSKRILRPLIENGRIPWYDDPRLPTLEALKRRGILPGAVRQFVLSLGFTKADTLAPFEALESFNRKMIDGGAIRLFAVRDPKKLTIKGMPVSSVEMPNHPSGGMGSRRVEVGDAVYVQAGDVADGGHVRLIGLGDVKVERRLGRLTGTWAGDDPDAGYPRIQWVPERSAHELKVLVPGPLFIDGSFNEKSLEEAAVLAEPHYLNVAENKTIQFVRFGYCRKESQRVAVYTHR